MLYNMPDGLLYRVKYSRDEVPNRKEFFLHSHSYYELLLFLSGDVTYLVEGKEYRPAPWDILMYDIAETHMVIVHSDVPYQRLVVDIDKRLFDGMGVSEELLAPFSHKMSGENNILHASDFKCDFWKQCINKFMEQPNPNRTQVLAWLLPLLYEIRTAYSNRKNAGGKIPLTQQLPRYVNDHLTEQLSPDDIAQHFFISRATLYNTFRKATGTSIHQYINVKRLILAQDLLKQGQRPMEVCETCGFKDYTTFFRAYKNLFRKSPKQDYTGEP